MSSANTEMSEILIRAAQLLGITDDSDISLLKVVDTYDDNNLVMLHYNPGMDVGSLPINHPVRQVRGTIVDMTKEQVVCASFGYVPTVPAEETPINKELTPLLDTDGHSHDLREFGFMHDTLGYYKSQLDSRSVSGEGPPLYDIFPAFDGTLLRVWKYGGELMVSSHKKITTDKSHWGTSQTFRSLFNRYMEVAGMDPMRIAQDDMVANFVLVNRDLMVASKFPIESMETDGFLIFTGYTTPNNTASGNTTIGQRSWDFPYDLPSVKFYGTLPKVTVFGPWSLEENMINRVLQNGFHNFPAKAQSDPLCLGESVIISYAMTDSDGSTHRNHIRISSPAHIRRERIVGNDPNIHHRAYTILDESYYPKKGGDTYLDRFPPIENLTDEQIGILNRDRVPIVEGPINGSTPTMEELTDKKDEKSHEKRYRNAMMWYALSLSQIHQLYALSKISVVLRERKFVAEFLVKNRQNFSRGNYAGFENLQTADSKTFNYMMKHVENAFSFAKENAKGNPGLIQKYFKNNVETGVYRMKGEYVYKMFLLIARNIRDEAPPMAGAGEPSPIQEIVPEVEINFDLKGPNDTL